jgi:hypothetical protein
MVLNYLVDPLSTLMSQLRNKSGKMLNNVTSA